MINLPEWARSWLPSQTTQVSHGLNLVLELKSPADEMPLLLWDIAVAQAKITQALEGLSFVHYARFIPSWDGRALMVTTEFDGPIDPYVLDFVIALGDVFDTLLRHVAEPPPLPVRDHPNDFLEWVRKWNQVPFSVRTKDTLFPEDFDYPVYSAYPTKTVTDIAGQRTRLPPPAIDHPAAAVDLSDVQGNILRGYGARHGRYMLFSVSDPAVARIWLAQDLARSVSSATPWTETTPPVLTQVAFTHEGLASLLPPERASDLAKFPVAFSDGAEKRADANFDRGSSAPEHWIFGRAIEPVHVVLLLYSKVTDADPPQAYRDRVDALEKGAAKGLKHLRTLEGKWLGGFEPFGFADGLSDPPISGQCPDPEPAYQPTASPGEFLLHKSYASIYGGSSLGDLPERLATNGSFGVLRLMEQDVDLFKKTTDAQAPNFGIQPEHLRAKLVGRWKSGAPLAMAPRCDDPKFAKSNAFDYAPSWEFPDQPNDHEGLLCPVGAHIRRANPRTARVAGQPHSRRLIRRGMPAVWQDQDGSGKIGLMGLFFQANLERQFEFIQRQWLQGDLAASGVRGTIDAIASIRSEETEFRFLEPNPSDPTLPSVLHLAKIPPLIRTRGCLYLFFPGISALKALATDAPPAGALGAVRAVARDVEAVAAGAIREGGELVAGATGAWRGLIAGIDRAHAELAHSAKAAILRAEAELPAHAPHLPDVPGDALRVAFSDFERLLEAPALHRLDGGKWRDLIQDLTKRNLDSPRIKDMLSSFAPTISPVAPPAGIDVADFDLSSPLFRTSPFKKLEELRQKNVSIAWVPSQQACWVVGYEACQDLLKRNTQFLQAASGTPLRGIATMDDPRHIEVRTAFLAAFTAALAALGPKLNATVDSKVADLSSRKELRQFDYMREFAHPVSRAVVWELIGIQDPEKQSECDALADILVMNYGRPARGDEVKRLASADAALRLAARLGTPLSRAWLISSVPGNPYEGTLIGELAARTEPGLPVPHARPLDFVETLITLVQTVLASQSPHFLLGTAALHLLRDDPTKTPPSSAWSKLAKLAGSTQAFDDALRAALDEGRRFEPPLTILERYANGQQTICGITVPDGCPVFAVVASANRDASVYKEQAEEFQYDRAGAPAHLSLGYGAHECAGRALQAQLVPSALGAMIRAMPDLRLSNPTAVPAWCDTVYFRVLQALSVTRCPP